jgi:VWFA-related protein
LRQVHPEDQLGIYLMGTDRFWVLHEYNQSCADLLERLASWKGTAAPGSAAAKLPDVWTAFAVHFAHVDDETAKAIHRSQFYTSDSMGSSALPEGATSLPKMHQGIASSDTLGQQAPSPPVGGLRAGPAQTEEGAYIMAGRNHPIEMLRGVAEHLASVPGRKNVILISGKMFLPAEFKDQVKVLRTIIQDGVAVYAIDPGGLAPYTLDASFVIPSKVTASAPNAKLAADRYIKQNADTKQEIIRALQSSLRTLAEATGGQVFVNTNGIQEAIRSSFNDSRVTYTLGFYPQISGDDGSFHPIKVRLPGQERLSVRYRTGYFEPLPPSRDPRHGEAEVQQAIWSPVDASAIELNGDVLPVAGANDYELKLYVGLAAVSLQPDGDRWAGKIEVTLVQRDDFGNGYDTASQTLGLMLKKDTYNNAVKNGFPYSRSFKLNPKTTSLRVVVRDLNSANQGTLTIPSR